MRMAQADRFTAVILFALGIAMLVGGWTMDRLEIRQIHPASIPGLVPIILGVLLALCSVLLLISSFSQDDRGDEMVFAGGSWGRLGLTGLTCVVYAIGLVGWLSFTVATALFTFTFALIFSFPVERDRRAQATAAVSALILAVAVSVGAAQMFEKLFLVRLP